MLVLSRRNGEWIELVHRSGDVLRFRVYDLAPDAAIKLAFEDPARNFEVHRPSPVLPRPGVADVGSCKHS
jgi:hypothetical protein